MTIDDIELLATAHLDLLAALADGVTVLGRSNGPDLIRMAHSMRSTGGAPAVPLASTSRTGQTREVAA